MKELRKLFVISRFELLQRLRSPVLVSMLVVAPLLTILTTLIPLRSSLEQRNETQAVVGVIDETGSLTSDLNAYFSSHALQANGRARIIVYPLTEGEQGRSDCDLVARLKQGGSHLEIHVLSNARADKSVVPLLQAALSSIQGQAHDPQVMVVDDASATDENQHQHRIIYLISVIALNILTLTLVGGSGQLLVRSLFEERSTKVLDVMVSSASARTFLMGKYIGVLAFGLIHCVVWAVVFFLSASSIVHLSLSWQIVIVSSHAFMTFLFFTSLYLVFAARVEKESTAQALSTFTTLALVIPLSLLLGSQNNAQNAEVSVMSLLPPYASHVIAVRLLSGITIPPLSHVFSLGLTALGTLFCTFYAVRSFESITRRGGAHVSSRQH